MIYPLNLEKFRAMKYPELIEARHKALSLLRLNDPLAFAYEELVLEIQEYVEKTYLPIGAVDKW